MSINQFESTYKPPHPNCTFNHTNCDNCTYGFDKYIGNTSRVIICTNPRYKHKDAADLIMNPTDTCEYGIERHDEDGDDDYTQQSINGCNQLIENFNRNFSNNDLNIFSKIMVSIAKFFMKVGYNRVSTVIPEKNKKHADAVVDALTESSSSFRPNDALTELLSETNHSSHKLLNTILLIIDAILTISVLSLIGYGIYYFVS